MKSITSLDFERIKRSRPKVERTGPMKDILELEIGHAVIILKEEWTMQKKNVVSSIHSFARSERLDSGQEKKFRVKTLPDGSGWAVHRVI